jgi:hypothetical protein
MPQIELVPVPLYQPNQPYNNDQDNIPIQGLIDRILLVNSQVDIDADVLRTAVGSVGSLAARLAASLNDDGSLKTAAVDAAEHSIAHHIDGSVVISGVPYSYVRMTAEERAKLALVDNQATDLTLKVEIEGTTPSNVSNLSVIDIDEVVFQGGQVVLRGSDAITWRLDDDGALLADTTFPAAARHRHYYDVTPTHQNTLSPDYTNYKVLYAYKEGTMRVYVNGVRLSSSAEVMVPTIFGSEGPTWVPLMFTEDTASSGVVSSGKFSLSDSITSSEDIRVDYDALYS